MHCFTIYPLAVIALGSLVAGHGAIVAATGDKGGKGMAIGIDTSTPRDGTDDEPFQQDTTVFEGDAEFACGETDQTSENDAVNDIESGVADVMANAGSNQLPQISQGGEVRMTLHEVNSDGGGPYVCMIDATGTGQNWVAMEVTQQVPGDDGDNDEGEATDFPLTAAVAQDQTCTGNVAGQQGVCMVRCQNPQGPFGGCVPVQMNGNATAVANPKMSETGGTAEDDIDAIVDAAEEGQASAEESDDSSEDLFDRLMKRKDRKVKKAMRAARRNLRRKERREARKARKAEKRNQLV
ncbi:hypothetical protein FQN54_003494 [Arachnomyces sp. PD_36]|nr:hypothetical protein FQN54_003494 [Arachnomyces sp. PD_36]